MANEIIIRQASAPDFDAVADVMFDAVRHGRSKYTEEQPSTKSARLPTMLKLAEIFGYGQQHFLNEGARVAVLNVVPSQPGSYQRRVEIRQPIPTLVFCGANLRLRSFSPPPDT